jgi:hypothetical protein
MLSLVLSVTAACSHKGYLKMYATRVGSSEGDLGSSHHARASTSVTTVGSSLRFKFSMASWNFSSSLPSSSLLSLSSSSAGLPSSSSGLSSSKSSYPTPSFSDAIIYRKLFNHLQDHKSLELLDYNSDRSQYPRSLRAAVEKSRSDRHTDRGSERHLCLRPIPCLQSLPRHSMRFP